MQISIYTMAGRTIRLDVEPHNTIRLVKALIEEKEGIPVSQQRLVVPRDSLQDDRRLSDIDSEFWCCTSA